MGRPFVYVNMAMTADGKITSAAREYPRFTSEHDRLTMDRLRAEADAIVIGAGTMRADDPPLGVRNPEMRRYRASLGKPEGLLNVVVSASASLDPKARFFSDRSASGRIVVTVEATPREKLRPLADRAEIWTCGREAVDLAALCDRLAARGVDRLLLEGGGEMNWSFMANGLIDEIHLTLAPVLLGGRDAPTPVEGTGFAMTDQRRLRLLTLDRVGDEIYLRYAVEGARS